MGRIVICDECGYINDYEATEVKDRGGAVKLFICANCGNTFFKWESQIKKDEMRIRAENNSMLGRRIRETEKLIEELGEEDKNIKILANLLVEIGRKRYKKG